ncbi:hypothetical protein HGRIS_010908 [Hohenbuehelia grisea]|uniref:Uncharacterized protein n=1 Tax=Hohenbuehelia grisea TaxID=104357 RepID=A0ABR3IYC2_9AGAR
MPSFSMPSATTSATFSTSTFSAPSTSASVVHVASKSFDAVGISMTVGIALGILALAAGFFLVGRRVMRWMSGPSEVEDIEKGISATNVKRPLHLPTILATKAENAMLERKGLRPLSLPGIVALKAVPRPPAMSRRPMSLPAMARPKVIFPRGSLSPFLSPSSRWSEGGVVTTAGK